MKGPMRVIDKETGLMECSICGARHSPTILPGGRFARGSWQCANGCKRVIKTKKLDFQK
jgi:hypothetical protein